MNKIILSDNQLANLFIFLDRVEIKGFKEVQAINELLSALNNPLNEEQESNKSF